MPQRRDNAGAVCNSGMGMLFLCIYFLYIISFCQRSFSVKARLASKVIFRQRLSSVKGRLPSKVVFRQRSSSLKGYLILSYSIQFDCSTKCGIAQLSLSFFFLFELVLPSIICLFELGHHNDLNGDAEQCH